jgi:hypothetical protein
MSTAEWWVIISVGATPVEVVGPWPTQGLAAACLRVLRTGEKFTHDGCTFGISSKEPSQHVTRISAGKFRTELARVVAERGRGTE